MLSGMASLQRAGVAHRLQEAIPVDECSGQLPLLTWSIGAKDANEAYETLQSVSWRL
jgi:hypothetical protein